MKLAEAIEIKQLALDTGIVNDPDEFKEADQLSIEALKTIQALKRNFVISDTFKLVGETKD